jgi:hypothetical protein
MDVDGLNGSYRLHSNFGLLTMHSQPHVSFYRLANECSSFARRKRQLSVARREKQMHGAENCSRLTQLALLPLGWF